MKKWHVVVSVLLLGGIALFGYIDSLRYQGLLRVSMLNVGQGDAILITDPAGFQILIDGGPSNGGVITALESQMPLWDRSIDMLLLSHPDADHVAGFVDVLERYSIGTIVDNSVAKDTDVARAFRVGSVAEKAISRQVYSGGVIKTPGGVELNILHPDKYYESSETNNYSIVVRMVYGQTSFLFTGDMDTSVENELVQEYGAGIQSTVLKIPHHGSRYSSSLSFLQAVRPEIALASYDCKNDYGHPNPIAVRRYEYLKIPVYTTCDRGTFTTISDGVGVYLE